MASQFPVDPTVADQQLDRVAGDDPAGTVADMRASDKTRVTWIDVARGIAIILIVMHHARDYTLIAIPPHPGDVLRWAYVEPLLVHIRLPLFFTLSGALAFGLSSGAGPTVRSRRIIALAIVYLVWSLLMLMLVPAWPDDRWFAPTGNDIVGLLHGASVLWYIWALAIAFAFTSLTRKLPAPLVLICACAISVGVAFPLPDAVGNWERLARYLPLYVLGARYGRNMLVMAQWRNMRAIALILAIYCLLLNPDLAVPGLTLLHDAAGATLGIAGSAWAAATWPGFTARFAWLGQRTLPIYVFHFPLIAWLGCAVVDMAPFAHRPLALLLLLPALVAGTIGISLLLWLGLNRLGLAWTLAMPPRRGR